MAEHSSGSAAEAQLTEREQEVIELAADGTASPVIANTLGLSVRTVENHLARIYRKLGISSRAELAPVAARLLAPGTEPRPDRLPSDSPVIVGRADELNLLHGLLGETAKGRGAAVLIEGEPGIGKTALVRTILAHATTLGCQIFWGTGDELGQELPLAPFFEAMRIREPSASARRAEIAKLLRGNLIPDHGDITSALSEKLLALACEQSAAQRTILAIDDMQWADPASITLWSRLARMTSDRPLLLVASMRPVPLREDLTKLRRIVAPEARIQLTALPDPAVADLVAHLIDGNPDTDLLSIAADAGGNPRYLAALIDALFREDRITITGSGTAHLSDGSMPATLSATISNQLDFITAPAREMLKAAALLGDSFSITDLASVMKISVTDLIPVIDEATTAGVLTESGYHLKFRHPVIRQALCSILPAAVLRALHYDAAHALAATGATPSQVAVQLLRGITSPSGIQGKPGDMDETGDGMDIEAGSSMARATVQIERPPAAPGTPRPTRVMEEWVLEWLTSSADTLVDQAPGAATELLSRAIEENSADSGRRSWLTSRLASALYRTGDIEAAAQLAERELTHTADPDLLVDLYWTLAHCSILSGHADETLAAIEHALSSPGLSVKHHARMLLLSARIHLHIGDYEMARETADSALASANQVSDTWGISWALLVIAMTSLIQGEFTMALSTYDRALAVTRSDPTLTDLRLLLQVNKASTLATIDRYEEALTVVTRTRQLADQVGNAIRFAQAHSVLGQILYETGRWSDALAEISTVAENLKEPAEACADLAIMAVILFHQGDAEGARRCLDSAAPHSEHLGHRFVPELALAQSMDRELTGNRVKALDALIYSFDETEDLGQLEGILVDAVRLATANGRSETARKFTERAATLAADSQVPHRQANGLYCQGLVESDPEKLLAAAIRYDEAGRPLYVAMAYEAAASLFILSEDEESRTQAREAMSRSVETYESLGAAFDVARVQAVFRRYGIRRGPHSKRRRAESGWESLTPMEMKIAGLVSQGLSNPEIAERLVLSRRTVGTHVSHILKKLAVASRADIARQTAMQMSRL